MKKVMILKNSFLLKLTVQNALNYIKNTMKQDKKQITDQKPLTF